MGKLAPGVRFVTFFANSIPYSGTYLPLGITYPNNAGAWEVLSVVYGYIMWVACAVVVILFLVRRGTREIAHVAIPGLAIGITDFIKFLAQQPRPPQSCLYSCGMPSGHSAVAMCFLTYFVLESVFMIQKSSVLQFSTLLKGAYLVPFGAVSQSQYYYYIILWSVLLFPIPVSRIITGDHTAAQVLAGAFVGIITGFLWFLCMLKFRVLYQAKIGQKYLFGIIVHNYSAPVGWKQEDEVTPTAAAV
jgi:membrane-associated phospholipid phosphatase